MTCTDRADLTTLKGRASPKTRMGRAGPVTQASLLGPTTRKSLIGLTGPFRTSGSKIRMGWADLTTEIGRAQRLVWTGQS